MKNSNELATWMVNQFQLSEEGYRTGKMYRPSVVCEEGSSMGMRLIKFHLKTAKEIFSFLDETSSSLDENLGNNIVSAVQGCRYFLEVVALLFKEESETELDFKQGDKDSNDYNVSHIVTNKKRSFEIAKDKYYSDQPRLPRLLVSIEDTQNIESIEEAAKKRRSTQFVEFSKDIEKIYGKQILQTLTKKKGKVLKMMQILLQGFENLPGYEVERAIKLSKDQEILSNLLILLEANVSEKTIVRVTKKANARKYLEDALPEVHFSGTFDSIVDALELYCQHFVATNENRMVYSC